IRVSKRCSPLSTSSIARTDAMTLVTLSPSATCRAIAAGARLTDIRGADEYARERNPGAEKLPPDVIGQSACDGRRDISHCKSGMRAAGNAAQLAAAAGEVRAYILEGGIDAWRGEGQATLADRSQPLEIMRQVQISAGGLVLAGVLLGI